MTAEQPPRDHLAGDDVATRAVPDAATLDAAERSAATERQLREILDWLVAGVMLLDAEGATSSRMRAPPRISG